MDEHTTVSQLDDFQVIAEWREVSETLAALVDRYRELNKEMGNRVTLRWMLP